MPISGSTGSKDGARSTGRLDWHDRAQWSPMRLQVQQLSSTEEKTHFMRCVAPCGVCACGIVGDMSPEIGPTGERA